MAKTKGSGLAGDPATEGGFHPAFATLKRSLRQLLWMTGLVFVLVVALAWRVYS